jgi:hypothetical protein
LSKLNIMIGGLIAVALLALIAAIAALYVKSKSSDQPVIQAMDLQLITCARQFAGSKVDDPKILNEYSKVCYDAAYNQASINDFNIRRNIFNEQPYLDRILLWTVVFITISGVILSAVQLVTSYKLAVLDKSDANTPSNLTIQKNKITLQSSIVGLFILTMSLAFFVIFVYGVYVIKETKSDFIEGATGGLGRPPIQRDHPVSPPATTKPQ